MSDRSLREGSSNFAIEALKYQRKAANLKKWLPKVDSRGHHWVDDIEAPELQEVTSNKSLLSDPKTVTKKVAQISLRDRAAELAASRLTVRTKDFEAIGVPRQYMTMMCEEGILERVGFGTYRLAKARGN